jgi:hypothetical protein
MTGACEVVVQGCGALWVQPSVTGHIQSRLLEPRESRFFEEIPSDRLKRAWLVVVSTRPLETCHQANWSSRFDPVIEIPKPLPTIRRYRHLVSYEKEPAFVYPYKTKLTMFKFRARPMSFLERQPGATPSTRMNWPLAAPSLSFLAWA